MKLKQFNDCKMVIHSNLIFLSLKVYLLINYFLINMENGLCMISACGAGFYGQLCDKRCPAECANGFCNKDTGICCFRDEKGPYCEGGERTV